MTALKIDRTGTLVDAHGIAELLGCSVHVVRQWRYTGDMPRPAGRIGQADVWWADEVARWNATERPGGPVKPRRTAVAP